MSNYLHRQLVEEVAREVAEFQSASDLVDEAASARLGINRTDQRCLGLLHTRGTMSAGQLAQASGLSPGATTTAIDRLEKAGYARRERSKDDRRTVMVELTEEARQLIEEIYGPIGEAGTERLQKYSEEQLALLREFLREGQALQVEHAARIRSGGSPPRG
jgi:DNA-binding MarR family transcriptional regulator